MKFDSFGCLVREKPREPGHEIANLGDSCADTCRLFIVGGQIPNSELPDWPVQRFRDPNWKGWLRHPDLYALPGKEDWGTKGFTNDQLVPLLMAQYLASPPWVRPDLFVSMGFIKGTWKLAQPAVYAILWRQWWLLDLMNRAQGFLLGLPFRWSDDESEGPGFKSSKGKVQDYLNMVAIYVFLKKIGYSKARLSRPLNECVEALILYRTGKLDPEPNWEWEMQFYLSAIGSQVVLKKD